MNEAYTARILDAAYTLLSRHGLRRTSMADIVKESGVSKATLFRRFKSRADLLHSLMVREISRFLEELGKRLEGVQDPQERLLEIFVYFCQIAPHHAVLRRLIETDAETVLPLLTVDAQRLLAFGNAFIVNELQQMVQNGYRLTSSPEICAELLDRLSHSYLLSPASVAPLDDPAAMRDIFRATLVRLILAQTQPDAKCS